MIETSLYQAITQSISFLKKYSVFDSYTPVQQPLVPYLSKHSKKSLPTESNPQT